MLQLTENATTIVKSIAEQSQETAGLRITADDSPEPAFAVEAVPAGDPEDQVVEQDGATIFLDNAAAQQLDDKVLDAGVDGSGNVQFALGQQG